ncbi:hypothetical protein BDF14DRAFT_1850845 [Spinellus fusiger]|nr:hypothetical protein BDF14DRAFT_1850845 [Spinellus fusiger]
MPTFLTSNDSFLSIEDSESFDYATSHSPSHSPSPSPSLPPTLITIIPPTLSIRTFIHANRAPENSSATVKKMNRNTQCHSCHAPTDSRYRHFNRPTVPKEKVDYVESSDLSGDSEREYHGEYRPFRSGHSSMNTKPIFSMANTRHSVGSTVTKQKSCHDVSRKIVKPVTKAMLGKSARSVWPTLSSDSFFSDHLIKDTSGFSPTSNTPYEFFKSPSPPAHSKTPESPQPPSQNSAMKTPPDSLEQPVHKRQPRIGLSKKAAIDNHCGKKSVRGQRGARGQRRE